jgi:gliding motility-associated-like protein
MPDNNSTKVHFGDRDFASLNFRKYYCYRSVNDSPFLRYDSISSHFLHTTYVDEHSPGNKQNNYRYTFTILNQCGHEGYPSDTFSTFENIIKIPQLQKLNTVTVGQNRFVQGYWNASPEKDFARYSLYRSERGKEDSLQFHWLKDFIHRQDTSFLDSSVDVQKKSNCYALVMRDSCGNVGPFGKISCTMLLRGIAFPFENRMDWDPYQYWENGANTYLYADPENPQFIDSLGLVRKALKQDEVNYTENELPTETGTFHYYVMSFEKSSIRLGKATSAPTYASRSNTIELIQTPVMRVPNAYSDNGDGLNDSWAIRSIYVKDFLLKIYNKWGQLVFESTDKNIRWNGKSWDERQLPADVYIYHIEYTGYDDSAYSINGNLTILR